MRNGSRLGLALVLVALFAVVIGGSVYLVKRESASGATAFAEFDRNVLQKASVPAGVTTTQAATQNPQGCLEANGRPSEPVAVHYFNLARSPYESDPLRFYTERADSLGWKLTRRSENSIELSVQESGTNGTVTLNRVTDGGPQPVVEMIVSINQTFC